MNESESRVDILYQHCLDMPEADWESYLDRECRGDGELEERIKSRLKRYRETSGRRPLENDPSQSIPKGEDAGPLGPVDESPGDQIGRYRLTRLIGAGAWGTVWLAHQTQDIERKVALKILKLGLDTKDFLRRFESERRALSMMKHPNIAAIFDAGATEYGRPYLVMELVDGRPIIEYSDAVELGLEERIKLFIPVCQAIQHAHEKGIIHRDIKPSNVLVDEAEDEPLPKVIDFGIAKSSELDDQAYTQLTRFHTFLGTPLYSSPEQLRSDRSHIDSRTDIYSLGMLLYELVCGRPAFELARLSDSGIGGLKSALSNTDPPAPSRRFAKLAPEVKGEIATKRDLSPAKVGARLKRDLDWIIMKCLEKDPGRRYQSAKELVLDLVAFLECRPVSAAAPSPVYRARKFLRRRKVETLGAIAVVFAVACVVALAFAFQERSSDALVSQSVLEAMKHGKSIAVLPFQSAGDERDGKLLSDSFHGELISVISRIEAIKTISRNSTLRYRDSTKSSAAIAEELGVSLLLTGSVQRIDADMRVDVQLIDANSEQTVWSETYVRPYSSRDFFSIQSKIGAEVGRQLRAVLTPEETQRIAKVPTQNLDALEAYFKGQAIVESDIRSQIEDAIDYFKEAISLDPDFALAYVGLAYAYRMELPSGNLIEKNLGVDRRALSVSAFEKAFELDDSIPEVQVLAGLTRMSNRDIEGAREAFEKALQFNPNFPDAHFYLGYIEEFGSTGGSKYRQIIKRRLDKALVALKLEPTNPVYRETAAALLDCLGLREEALEHYRTLVRLNPDNAQALHATGSAMIHSAGRLDEAMIYLRRSLSLDPKRSRVVSAIRGIYDYLGDDSQGVRWTQREMALNRSAAPLWRANLLRLQGKHDESMEVYRRNLDNNKQYMNARLHVLTDDLRTGNAARAKERYMASFPNLINAREISTPNGASLASELASVLLADEGTTDKEVESALRLLDMAENFYPSTADSHSRTYNEAIIHALRGEKSEAIEKLTKAFDNGLRVNDIVIGKNFDDARLDSLREEPEFAALMKKLEKDLEEQLANIRRMEENGELAAVPPMPL